MWCYISKNGVKCIYSVHVEKPKNIKFGVIPTCSSRNTENAENVYIYWIFPVGLSKMCKDCKKKLFSIFPSVKPVKTDSLWKQAENPYLR